MNTEHEVRICIERPRPGVRPVEIDLDGNEYDVTFDVHGVGFDDLYVYARIEEGRVLPLAWTCECESHSLVPLTEVEQRRAWREFETFAQERGES